MPKPKTENIRVNLLMPPAVVKGLKALAQRRGTTYSELIRSACREYVTTELRNEARKRV